MFWQTSCALLCTLALAACASTLPPRVITLTPEGPFEWAQGRALLRYSTEPGIDFSAAFERDRGEYLEWWVRIDNRSKRSWVVSPKHFYYRVAETERGGNPVSALDPTHALAELDAARARSDPHEAAPCRPYGAGDFVADVFEEMLGLDPPSPSEARRACEERRAAYLAERDRQERWRELLANQTVRRTLVRPGESLQGIVLFPRLEHPGRTELLLIVGRALARFRYQATTHGEPISVRLDPESPRP